MLISIRKLDTNRSQDIRTWVAFPYQLYARDSLWVPMMMDEARSHLDRQRFPYYLHSDADFLIAERGGDVVGRLALMENRRYNRQRNERTGLFTEFECIESFDVAQSLFDAALAWCQERGLERLVGPKGFLPTDSLGLLAEGFHRLPAIGIAYNPPYYAAFLERLGFERETDFLSGYLSTNYELPLRVISIAEKVKERSGFRVEQYASKKELKAIVKDVIATYNACFVDNWEYVPITDEEGVVIAAKMLDIIQPELIRLVWKGDAVAGFILVYPDISRGIQRAGGKLWPFGFLHILREFRRTDWINLNGAGILPQYQGRGVDAMMFAEMAKVLSQSRYRFGEVVQIDEGNTKMQREMASVGVEFDKRHRIFRREL